MSKEIKIGLLALFSGLILYYGFNFLKGSEFFSRSDNYYTIYNNIGALAKSNPVKINGVPVGKVNGIRLLPKQGNKVLVRFDVEESVIIGDSAIAELTSDLLGTTSIILRVGDVSKPMEPGDTVISRVDKGLAEILESAQPVANNINVTINKLSRLLDEFAGIGIVLKQTVENLDTTILAVNGLLERNDRELNALFRNTNSLLTNLDNRVSQLEPLLTKAEIVVDSLDTEAITQTITDINTMVGNLNKLVQGMEEGTGTMGKLMKDDSLYNTLNKTLIDLDSLLIHFDQYPKDFLAPLGRKHHKLKGK